MRLKARWDLFLYQERAPETISFSPYQNTAQLVSVGYILRCSRREMSVCCKAAGQEHDRKNEDQPARHSTLSKITHNQREYVSPRSGNVKLEYPPTAFSSQANRRQALCQPHAERGKSKRKARGYGKIKVPSLGNQMIMSCDRNV
jgi:hypothetical protein